AGARPARHEVLMNVADVAFDCMGTEMRVICEGPRAERAAEDARAWLRDADARLSRFRPGSELCALNGDPRDVVAAAPLLCAALAAGRWAAERTGGLVDPTLVGALCRAGYARSRAGVAPAPLGAALASATPRRPAAPHPAPGARGAAPRRGLARDRRRSRRRHRPAARRGRDRLRRDRQGPRRRRG